MVASQKASTSRSGIIEAPGHAVQDLLCRAGVEADLVHVLVRASQVVVPGDRARSHAVHGPSAATERMRRRTAPAVENEAPEIIRAFVTPHKEQALERSKVVATH